MLTSYHYTVLPSIVEEWKAVKNDAEMSGMRAAYIRDGAAYVKWLAWLDYKLSQGYDITEYEAAWRLTEFRRKGKNYMGLAYENISASGKNAGAFDLPISFGRCVIFKKKSFWDLNSIAALRTPQSRRDHDQPHRALSQVSRWIHDFDR